MVFDPDHGMIEPVRRWIRLLDRFGIFHLVVRDDFDPVIVRVEGESHMPHSPIRQLLLEFVAGIFDALACGLDVIDGDADVAETAAGVGVAVGGLVIRVVFGAVIVGELEDALAVVPGGFGGNGGGGVVGEEVEIEFGVGLGDLLDE